MHHIWKSIYFSIYFFWINNLHHENIFFNFLKITKDQRDFRKYNTKFD